MRIPFMTLTLLIAPTVAAAQTLTDDERATLLSSLERTDEQIVRLAESLTPEQWNYKPAEDRWSVAEVAEHILISEQVMKKIITGPLMEAPVTEERMASETGSRDIERVMADRGQRFQAPDFVQPTGRWPTQAEFLAAWRQERDATLEWVETTQADLHGHAYEHPAAGLIDGAAWLTLVATHCERHLNQIEEVMADASYPASEQS